MGQKIKINKMDHPYKIYESSLLWEVMQKALDKMINNNDIILNTSEVYVIGFLCKQLDQEKLLNTAIQHNDIS